jgi:DNA-binding transcriptional LysR family regulator
MATAEVPHVTLAQWRTLVAVVDAGGYAQAAELLHKSQSALTYAVQKLESQLDVEAFTIQGRKAVLTPIGQMLYRRAHALLDEAAGAERAAKTLSAGWEAEIRIAVEILFVPRAQQDMSVELTRTQFWRSYFLSAGARSLEFERL